MYRYFTNKSQYMTVCYRKKKCIQDILRIGVASSLLVLKWVAIFERLGTTVLDWCLTNRTQRPIPESEICIDSSMTEIFVFIWCSRIVLIDFLCLFVWCFEQSSKLTFFEIDFSIRAAPVYLKRGTLKRIELLDVIYRYYFTHLNSHEWN